jgi:hypothetical protein
MELIFDEFVRAGISQMKDSGDAVHTSHIVQLLVDELVLLHFDICS